MIEYFKLPVQASIKTTITKKMFSEKASLNATEKKILREDIHAITMRGLLQTSNIGLQSYVDDAYLFDQIVFTEVELRDTRRLSKVCTMIQKTFPAPMVLILRYGEEFCVNWCLKRINQADKTKRVLGELQQTRLFVVSSTDEILTQWLASLDISTIYCDNIKELYTELSDKLSMLAIAEEAGCFTEQATARRDFLRVRYAELEENRAQQTSVTKELKATSQLNAKVNLTTKLKTLQNNENEIKASIRVAMAGSIEG